jgi:hypothetical protein
MDHAMNPGLERDAPRDRVHPMHRRLHPVHVKALSGVVRVGEDGEVPTGTRRRDDHLGRLQGLDGRGVGTRLAPAARNSSRRAPPICPGDPGSRSAARS